MAQLAADFALTNIAEALRGKAGFDEDLRHLKWAIFRSRQKKPPVIRLPDLYAVHTMAALIAKCDNLDEGAQIAIAGQAYDMAVCMVNARNAIAALLAEEGK